MAQPLTLLADFKAPLSQNDEARLADLYRSLPDETGSGMITYPGRWAWVDAALAEEIGGRPVRIREMAASNAVTSLELFERLSPAALHATDFFDAIYVAAAGSWRIVLDAERKPIQFIGYGLAISARKERGWFRRRIRKWLLANVRPDGEVQRVSLFHPRCLAIARQDLRFTLGRESVLEPEDRPCDVLRIMNLRPMDFRPAARLVTDGGLLVLGNCFTPESEKAATLFRRQGDHFVVARDIGAGYDRKQTILDMTI